MTPSVVLLGAATKPTSLDADGKLVPETRRPVSGSIFRIMSAGSPSTSTQSALPILEPLRLLPDGEKATPSGVTVTVSRTAPRLILPVLPCLWATYAMSWLKARPSTVPWNPEESVCRVVSDRSVCRLESIVSNEDPLAAKYWFRPE